MQPTDYLGALQGVKSGFNPYSAGNKQYGTSMAPNQGAVSNKLGYAIRDNKAKGMKAALLRRMKASQLGKFASPAAQKPAQQLFAGPGGN